MRKMSPSLFGRPTAPTADPGTSDDQLATTAFVGAAVTAGTTAASLLTKLLTVDGAGSGLDADLLDGLSSAAFAQNAFKTLSVAGQSDIVADSPTDTLTIVAGSNVTITTNAATDTLTIASSGGGGLSDGDYGDISVSGTGTVMSVDNDAITNAKLANMAEATIKGRAAAAGAGDPTDLTAAEVRTLINVENGATADQTAAEILTALLTVDGAGSGLDADTLDGLSSASFAQNAFKTIAVAGQSDVVADAPDDTLTLVAGSNVTLTTSAAGDSITIAASGGGGISDGDKGDITVGTSGTVWTIDNDVVTYAKMQNVSATDKLLGRSTAGAGDVEEITCTAAGRALLDDAAAVDQRATLGFVTTTTDNAACRFDSTAGLTQNSALIIADSTGALSRSGNGGIPLQGTNTNDAAAAGNVGEYVSATLASGSATSLVTATAKTVTSISLTAGDWDVRGCVAFTNTATTNYTVVSGGISQTANTLPTNMDLDTASRFQLVKAAGTTGAGSFGHNLAPCRISLNATTTIYLIAFATFSASTVNAYGWISARRVR
jgi:hypothetical protein